MRHPTERLSAYLDGELRGEERSAVETHLESCGECTRMLDDMRAVDAAARGLPAEAPEGYFEAFPGRLRRRLERPRRTVPARPALWAAVAAALLVAVLAPLALRQRAPTTPPPAAYGPPPSRPVATPGPVTVDRQPKREAPAAAPPPAQRLRAPAVVSIPPATMAPPAATAPANQERAEEKTRDLADRADAEKLARARPQAAAEAAGSPAPEAPPPAMKAARKPAGFMAQASAPSPKPAEDEYRRLVARWPASAAEARELSQAWRVWAAAHPEGVRGDQARVRALELGAEAWRLGHDERDRDRVRAEAEAYLRRPDALQAARVRALLEALGR